MVGVAEKTAKVILPKLQRWTKQMGNVKMITIAMDLFPFENQNERTEKMMEEIKKDADIFVRVENKREFKGINADNNIEELFNHMYSEVHKVINDILEK